MAWRLMVRRGQGVDLIAQAFEAVAAPRQPADMMTGAGKSDRRRPPDPARRARDEDDLPRFCHLPVSLALPAKYITACLSACGLYS